MEQRPFENPTVRSFFDAWCKVNDSIRPQIIPREEWEQKSAGGLLQPRPDGMQNLLIPEDLQLWEMVEIMEAVDVDTFADNPKKQQEKAAEMRKLGQTFSDVGIYIAQRLDAIPNGKQIAGALAHEFYDYGQSLASGKQPVEIVSLEDISLQLLSLQEITEVDKFLAGDKLYAARQARAEKSAEKNPDKKDEIYEAERRKTLAQFFRVAEKAFLLQKKSGELSKFDERLKPWQSQESAHAAFLSKVERGMEKQIEMPKTELTASVFRRGMELLRTNMLFDQLPNLPPGIKEKIFYWENGETTLREALGIDRLKNELETIRQTNDLVAISDKEREIADLVQAAVSGFAYESHANNPSEMIATQSINCVGASMLGGAFLSELGIKYMVGSLPQHSILVLVTSDGKLEWRDMLVPTANDEITDDVVGGKSKTGKSITAKDVVAYANNPLSEGFVFGVKRGKFTQKLGLSEEEARQFLTIFSPEVGHKIQVLNNLGGVLASKDSAFKEEAVEAYQQAIAVSSNFLNLYNGLGDVLYDLGRKKEAIEAYKKGVAIDPDYAKPYFVLGQAFSATGHKKEAIESFEKFILLTESQPPKKQGDDMLTKARIRIENLKKLTRQA